MSSLVSFIWFRIYIHCWFKSLQFSSNCSLSDCCSYKQLDCACRIRYNRTTLRKLIATKTSHWIVDTVQQQIIQNASLTSSDRPNRESEHSAALCSHCKYRSMASFLIEASLWGAYSSPTVSFCTANVLSNILMAGFMQPTKEVCQQRR